MRIIRLIAAFMLCTCAPAAAEIVAVCGGGGGHHAAGLNEFPLFRLSDPIPGGVESPAPDAQIALWHDSDGFDLLTNWGGRDQRSLRAEGAEILGDEFGAGFVHLVIARAGGFGLEHFLFSLDDSHSGKMVWTAEGDSRGDNDDVVTVETVCVGPK